VRLDHWVLADPGTGGAHDNITVTALAAGELRAFGYWPDPATEAHGFTGAFLAPRWMLDFVGAVVSQVFHERPRLGPPVGSPRDEDAVRDKVTEAARRVVRRGLDDPAWASALLVVLQTSGLVAAAAFVRDSSPPPG
jgi:hypothetical protein